MRVSYANPVTDGDFISHYEIDGPGNMFYGEKTIGPLDNTAATISDVNNEGFYVSYNPNSGLPAGLAYETYQGYFSVLAIFSNALGMTVLDRNGTLDFINNQYGRELNYR